MKSYKKLVTQVERELRKRHKEDSTKDVCVNAKRLCVGSCKQSEVQKCEAK